MTTPSPLAVELAGLRRRFASMLYESMLLLGVLGFAFLLPQIGIGFLSGHALPAWVLWPHLLLVLGLYFVLLWRRNGQTLAMQTWRLQLVDQRSGLPPTLKQCLLRYVLACLSLAGAGAGLAWALFDRERQFLHDRFAGTCIVRLPGRPGEGAS